MALNKPVAFSFDGESSVYFIITHLVEAEMDDVVGKVMGVLGQERNWQEVMVLEEQSRLVKKKMMMENKPHNMMAGPLIRDLVQASGIKVLQSLLNETTRSNDLMQKPDSFWAEMVDELLVKAHSVVVKALPSSQVQMLSLIHI